MHATYEIGQIYKFPLADLIRSSKYNVRIKTDRTTATYQTGIEELGALILAQGLLQNLIGFQQYKGKKPTRIVEIVGGGRRLDALVWLASTGQIDASTYEIEVRVCTQAEALAKSLSENSGREALPPADQFRAFAALSEAGQTAEEISTAFGVDVVTIKRRLKLGNVSPRLFALYEEGKATLDQLKALALTEDHKTQEMVWDSLPDYQRHSHSIRNLITTQEIDVSNSRVARFVTLAAYEEAGGEVRRDLFMDHHSGYIKDAALLESLAVTKLEAAFPELASAGYAWIDYATNISYDELNKFGRVKPTSVPLTAEVQAEIDTLTERDEKIGERLETMYEMEDDFTAEQQAEFDALEAEREQIESKIEQLEATGEAIDPVAAQHAGVIVTIDHNGCAVVHRGLIRPEDKNVMREAQAVARADAGQPPLEQDDDQEEKKKAKGPHSEKLTRQLTAHRTAAMHAIVSERVDVALVILAHKLALSVFKTGYTYDAPSAAQISLQHTYLENESPDVKSCKALAEFGEKHQVWQDLLPVTAGELFDWLLKQEQSVILGLLAHCTAYSLTTVQGDERANLAAKQIGKAVGLDMADWWQPTKETYFAQVSKSHIISIVSETVSAEIAKPLGDMKKIPLTEAAEQHMRDTRWVPPILKAA